jgi:hypothetical protein
MLSAGATETRARMASASASASKPNRERLARVLPTSPIASASSFENCSADRALTSIMMTAWPA